jgi:ATP-dependent DNA ligase
VNGILPQLLNPIDEPEVRRLIRNPDRALQEKFDGRRVLIQKQGGKVTGINRKGWRSRRMLSSLIKTFCLPLEPGQRDNEDNDSP